MHYIVPGGGLSTDGKRWVPARQADWLLPVAKLAAGFARRMEEAVRAHAPARHAAIPAGTWRGRWVVHCQPAGSGAAVVRYLARYVGRTAISDGRIVAATDEAVTFRYTDSATQQRKHCTLSAAEFLRRYVLQSESDAGLYIGYSANLRRRLSEHQAGLSKATSYRGPWRLIHYEAYIEEADARGREEFLKSGAGRGFLAKQCRHHFGKHPVRRV